MDVKEAIARAKNYVKDLFEDDKVTQLRLEEVEHDTAQHNWVVTVGFYRPWETPKTRAQEVLESLGATSGFRRSYKVVRLSEDGDVISLTNPVRSDIAV